MDERAGEFPWFANRPQQPSEEAVIFPYWDILYPAIARTSDALGMLTPALLDLIGVAIARPQSIDVEVLA